VLTSTYEARRYAGFVVFGPRGPFVAHLWPIYGPHDFALVAERPLVSWPTTSIDSSGLGVTTVSIAVIARRTLSSSCMLLRRSVVRVWLVCAGRVRCKLNLGWAPMQHQLRTALRVATTNGGTRLSPTHFPNRFFGPALRTLSTIIRT
jgi:hypothetical protein